jgi:hypothetical protein
MPVYIEDQETSELIERYAKLKNTTKTGALRDLLRAEIAKLDRQATAEERRAKIEKLLGPPPEHPPEPIPKEYYDWLWHDDVPMPKLSPALKKELGIVIDDEQNAD